MWVLFTVQFIISVLLILVILLHSPKEEGMGSIGGMARSFGGESELEKGLDKVTTVLGVLFICISLLIVVLS